MNVMDNKFFVPYHIASTLSVLGFRENCYKYYDKCKNLLPNSKSFEHDNSPYIDIDDLQVCHNAWPNADVIDAPTWEQARIWLLENHHIYIETLFDSTVTKKWQGIAEYLDSESNHVTEACYDDPISAMNGIMSKILIIHK